MVDKLKTILNKFLKQIDPIKSVIYFLFLFLFFEFIWKLCVHEADGGDTVLVLGRDMTSLVYPICLWTAKATYWIVHNLLGYSDFNINGLFIHFEGALKLKIVWGCTGVKQIILFTFIMLCFWGPAKKKFGYIIFSIFILNFINILRLVVTVFVIKDGFPDWFILFNEVANNTKWDNLPKTYWKFYTDWYHFFHDGLFKWIYYDGVMFLLWLFWQEKINLPYQRRLLNKDC